MSLIIFHIATFIKQTKWCLKCNYINFKEYERRRTEQVNSLQWTFMLSQARIHQATVNAHIRHVRSLCRTNRQTTFTITDYMPGWHRHSCCSCSQIYSIYVSFPRCMACILETSDGLALLHGPWSLITGTRTQKCFLTQCAYSRTRNRQVCVV